METGSHNSNVAGQLVSQNGTSVGPLISVGGIGSTCCNAVAFDGTNYLMVWESDVAGSTGGSPGFTAMGQFINTSGVPLAQPFALTGTDVWLDGIKFLAYGGGRYLLTYLRVTNGPVGGGTVECCIAGRILSPDGSLGPEIRISTGLGSGSSIGFDGTNFLVIWTAGSEVRGRFVGPSGALGQEISISAGQVSGPVQVAFDGTNYLVVFHTVVGGSTLDVSGQLVSPAGALVGSVITISNDPGTQFSMGVAFDGTNYLTTWTDMQAMTNWVYGQYISKNGMLVGTKVTINSNAGTQFGGIAGFANGKYFGFINGGARLGSGGLTISNGTVSGFFMGPYQAPPPDPHQSLPPPPIDQTVYTVSTGKMPTAAVTTTESGTLGSATLTVSVDLSKALGGGSFAGQGQFAAGYNIYVVALVPSGRLGLTSATWFVFPASRAWAALGSPIAAFMEGIAPTTTDPVVIPILESMDVTQLLGTEIYVGYGTSDAEMLAGSRYRGVYKIQ